MASQQYKDRLMQAMDALPDEKAAEVVKLAESLCVETRPHRRRLGTCRDTVRIEPSFFDPLPDDLLDLFEGKGA
jgi:hypothetical protein